MSDPRAGAPGAWGPGDESGEAEPIGGIVLPVAQVTNDRCYLQLLNSMTTSGALGNNNLRVTPMFVPNTLTISHLGVEVTAAGDVGSTFRVGIYNASNLGGGPGGRHLYPTTLLAEAANTIDGAAIGGQEAACPVTLTRGLYWVGGAVQGAAIVQPTLRAFSQSIVRGLVGTSAPTNNTLLGYAHGSVTGTLPATFTTAVTTSGAAPLLWVRLA